MSASRSHISAQIPGGMTSGSPQLRRRLSLSLCCHFFVSVRNNIETLYQISLVKAFFLLYNTDTGEPRMQHPWRQREHPFSSDLIALTFWFSQCTRYWLRTDATLSVSAVCHPCPIAGSPYACCAPSSAAPVPVQGRPSFAFLAARTALPGCHSQHKVFTSYVCVKMVVSLPDCSFILPGS